MTSNPINERMTRLCRCDGTMSRTRLENSRAQMGLEFGAREALQRGVRSERSSWGKVGAGAAVVVVVLALVWAAKRNEGITAVTWQTNDPSGATYYAVLISNATDRAQAFFVQSEISLNGRDWESTSRDSFGGELKAHTSDSEPILLLVQPHRQRIAVHSWEMAPARGPFSAVQAWLRSRTHRPPYDTSYMPLEDK